jgi:hypothetical protein
MASGNDLPQELQGAWTNEDRRNLVGRFHRGLHRLLTAYDAWRQQNADGHAAVAQDLANRLETAGTDLDVCASNCHALANTLRFHAGVDGAPSATVHAAIRLSKVLGAPVVLTHTTIDQLAGKTLKLEYIEGANAIVQANGEYWGTPLDRVLVVQPVAEDAADTPAAPPPAAAEAPPAFVFRLHRLELSNAIQFLAMTARTGVLFVISLAGSSRGQMVLEMGRVVHATFDTHVGVDAVARMMNLESSTATFEDRDGVAERTLNLAIDQLLIEAAVQADEITA